MCGLSQVCESGSFTFFGKSQVLSDFAYADPSQFAGTPFDAPSVKSTMMRRPDCVPAGTVRNWSQPLYRPSTISVLPPGSVVGTSASTVGLSKPRPAGIG